MRARILSLHKAVAAVRYVPVRGFRGEQRCDAHMNELPIPCGPWEPWYKDRQSFYNKVLVSGVLWFVFSFSMAVWTGAFDTLWGPPCQPGPPSDMVEECDDEDS